MAKFVLLGDAFSEFIDREASPVGDQSLQQQKNKKRKKEKAKKNNEKIGKALKTEVTFSKF